MPASIPALNGDAASVAGKTLSPLGGRGAIQRCHEAVIATRRVGLLLLAGDTHHGATAAAAATGTEAT